MIQNMKVEIEKEVYHEGYLRVHVTVITDGQEMYGSQEMLPLENLEMEGYFGYIWERMGKIIKDEITKSK